MKFDRSEKLCDFLQKNQIFPHMTSIKEIYAGGSSYNFYVETHENKFFLKLLVSQKSYLQIKSILTQLNFIYPLEQENFDEFYLLAMPFVNGHKLRYSDCTPELFEKLKKSYSQMQSCVLSKDFIKAQQNMPEMIKQITSYLKNDKSFSGKMIDKYFWRPILSELVCLEPSNAFIHGDLTRNNILIDEKAQTFIVDFEQIRYGYEIEDICYLFLQLCGFRGLFGNLQHFQKLRQMSLSLFDEPVSQRYWLYGVQMFYLNHLCRRLTNKQKHSNLRKEMCFLWSLRQYFRLSRYLRSV